MNPVLAHCNKCYNIPSSGTGLQFFLTSCGNVYCQKCLGATGICKKCNKNCPRRVISNPSVIHLFQDSASKLSQVQKSVNFQSNRYNSFFKYTNARHTSLMRALKERDSKIQMLETQITENQNVIKELKQQTLQQQEQLQQQQIQHQISFQMPNPDDDMSQSFATNAVKNAIGPEQSPPGDNFLVNSRDNVYAPEFLHRNNYGNRPVKNAYESQRFTTVSKIHLGERIPHRAALLNQSTSSKYRLRR